MLHQSGPREFIECAGPGSNRYVSLFRGVHGPPLPPTRTPRRRPVNLSVDPVLIVREAGYDPATSRLSVEYSSTELPAHAASAAIVEAMAPVMHGLAMWREGFMSGHLADV